MKGRRKGIWIAQLLLFCTLLGCTDPSQTEHINKDKQSMNTFTENAPISLSLGESAESWLAKFPKMQVDKQPAGLNFYDVQINHKKEKMLTIRFESGKHSFNINHVLGLQGTENIDRPTEHIYKILIQAGLSVEDEEMHDQARQAFFKLLDDIVKAGWKPYLSEAYPRLTAKEIVRRVIAKESYADMNLRPEYTPTLEEWMQLGDGLYWNFHANHVEMQIRLSRDITRLDPHKPGAYFMSITIRPMTHAMQDGMTPGERLNWRAVWLKSLAEDQATRATAEAKEKAAGHQIDTDYQDPPMPPEH